MLLPNEAVNHDDLRRIVEEQFGEQAAGDGAGLEFVPLGEDSWCYRLGRLWVSVRRDLQGHVPAAYEAARELRQAGLEFVLAPLAGRDGKVVRAVGELPVVVFPFVNVTPISSGAPASLAESAEITSMLGRVHGAGVSAALPTEDYRFPFAAELAGGVAAAAEADSDCGPFSLRLHRLIVRHRDYIRALEAEAEQVAGLCAAADTRPVLTHGEPSAGNVLRGDGGLLLADWGAAMWGPPERDWYHARSTAGVPAGCRPEFLRFYELRWVLGEISEYTSRFGRAHAGDDDDAAMWRRLTRYLPDVREDERPSPGA
jgi:spectinomycin phosphotransferase